MAKCVSDLKIEVAREGDFLKEDQELTDIPCEKNPGHHGFIPFKDLTVEDIPGRNIEIFTEIKTVGNSVVRLVVEKIENGRQKRDGGSGYVRKIDNVYYICTNNHVVKNNEDCRNCTVEFYYNYYDRSNIITSRGVELVFTCPLQDVSYFTFDPVPDYLKQLHFVDNKLFEPTLVIKYKNDQMVRYESSIQYKSQNIINFTGIDLNDQTIDMMFLVFSDDSISYLTSSYLKFQPIPSNIQDITNIEIHVDEDDGNSTVISGDVVKFGDEYVVKISESIFQDKVKKCRMVWNGEVISRCTRLYFQQFPSIEFFSDKRGVDLEDCIERYPTNVWVFDFQPKPRELQRCVETEITQSTNDQLYCIGHPHGGIKMVTFGRLLETSLERFDNHGRRIVEPGEDCQYKEVSCVKYSCKTCPGSSGSPVSWLHRLLFLEFCPIHFLGEKVNPFYDNGTLVENINTAWY